jgi:hypothetical protein
VSWGTDPRASFGRMGDITLDATSYNQNQGFTVAGGGGVFSGSAAETFAEAGDKSASKLSAEVSIADWDNSYRFIPVEAGGIYISASSDVDFFAGTDSTTVSVVGGAGAISYGTVDTNVQVDLGENVSFESFEFDLDAVNKAAQIQNPYFSSFESSIYAAGGGVANGTAGLSNQNIKNLNTEIIIGKNGVIKISDLAWFDANYSHEIEIDATSDFYIYDESKLEVGGALQGAGSESDVDVNSTNKITIEEGVAFINPVGDIGIGAYGTGSATAQANVTVWAAAGVVGGVSDVFIDVDNILNVGNNVSLNSYGDIGIYAGRGSDYFNENQIAGSVYTNVYNWTAIPIPAGNKAESDVYVSNKVQFGSGINIGSDSDVFIEANEGSIYDNHNGVEKNPYLELFNTETTFGSSDTVVDNSLIFLGDGQVTAGQYAYQSVDITNTSNGNVDINSVLYRYGSAERSDTTYSSRAELEAYIADLNTRIVALEALEDNSISVDGITIEEPDAETGVTTSSGTETETSQNISDAYEDQINELRAEIVLLEAVVDDLSSVANKIVEVKNVLATAGNVNLVASSISIGAGSTPTFTAKGDAYINIDNRSDEHLGLNNLQISNKVGGNVFVTGGATLSSTYIDEQNQTTTKVDSGIHINHAPEQVASNQNYLNADVIIQGDLVNLQSGIDITVAEGDLIQQATIEASSIQLNVSGTLLLNNPNVEQAYGFSPSALVNFVDKWKPSNANDFVSYYLSDKYQTAIDTTGVTLFNNWFTGAGIRNGIQPAYYQNDGSCKSCSYGYDEMNLYFNWGFADADEYNGADAVTFVMGSASFDRGGYFWKFQPVSDKTSSLDRTATYAQVKADGAVRPSVSIVGEKVIINAARLDINGTIEVGQDNNWSVNVASTFDSEIARYIADAGLSAGDSIDLTPGQALWLRVNNPDYNINPFNGSLNYNRYVWQSYNTGVTVDSGASAIGLTYDVGSSKLLADNIPVSGGGYVDIRARISSSGADGNITVRDGLGSIDIDNNSGTGVVLNGISAGDDATGIIRITDLNKSSTVSKWYVHSPGEKIQHYETTAWEVTFDGDSSTYLGEVGTSSGSGASVDYNTLAGQLYYIREGATIARSFNPPGESSEPYDGGSLDGYFAKYSGVLGEWGYEKTWQTETNDYTTCASAGAVCSGGTAKDYLTHQYDYDGESTWGVNWGLSYSAYYGTGLTSADPYVRVAYRLDMDTHTYVKADHDIALNFIGSATGSIDISSVGNVEFLGNVYNPNGTTSIQSNNNVNFASDAAITADALNLSAKGSLGSEFDALSIITDELSVTSTHGSIYLDVQGSDGDISIGTLSAKYDVAATFDKGIAAKNSNSVISGDSLVITSETGGIGSVGTLGNTATYDYINISASGSVKLYAAKDIAVNQTSGDLALYSAEAKGDIVIKLDDGNLVSAQNRYQLSEEELTYQASVWDSLNLLDANAGETTVSSFENKFTYNYHIYWLLSQRITDDSDANFAIDSSYTDALKLRYNVTTEAEMLTAVKAEYKGVQQWFDDQIATPDVFASEAAKVGIAQKGLLNGYLYDDLFTGTYDSDYVLALDSSSSWYAGMIDGARKTESQLTLTINAIEGDASDNSGGNAASKLTSKGSNITGSGVHLITNNGRIGENLSDLIFTVEKDGSTALTDAQKAALLSAGDGDVSFIENGTSFILTIKQLDPIKLDATGELYVDASKEVYLESARAISLAEINVADNFRLYTSGNISGVDNKLNISAVNVQLTSTGSIGNNSVGLNISSSGVIELIDADSDVYLEHLGSDLVFDSLSAGGTISLTNNADLISNSSTSTIKANGFIFDFSGYDVGTSAQGINLSASGIDGLSLLGDNAWINTFSGSGFTLAGATLTNMLNVSAFSGLNINGDINAASFTLDGSGNQVSSGNGYTINAGTSLWMRAASLDLDQISLVADSIYANADGSTLTVDNISALNGALNLLATSTLTVNGDIQALAGDILLDANVVTMTGNATLASSGSITANGTNQVSLREVNAAAGTLTVNGGASGLDLHGLTVNNLMVNSDSSPLVNVTIGDAVVSNLGIIKAQTLNIDGVVSGGTFDLDAANGISQNAAIIVNDITLRSGTGQLNINDDLSADNILITDSDLMTLANGKTITADALGIDVTAISMAQDSTLDVESSFDIDATGNVILHNVDAETAISVDANALTVTGGMTSENDIQITSTNGSVIFNDSVIALENLTINAFDGLLAEGLIQSGLNLNITSSNGGVTTNGAVISSGLLAINAKDNVALNDEVSVVLASNINSDSNIIINNAFSSDGRTQLLAAGSVAINADTAIQNDLVINSGDNVILNGNLTIDGLLDVDAVNTVSVTADKTLAITKETNLDASNVMMASNSTIDSEGAVQISSTQDTVVHNIDAESLIKISAENITINGMLDAIASIDLDSVGGTQINGTVNSNANLTINANTGLVANAALSSTNDLLITSANGSVVLNDSVMAGGNLTIEAINDLLAEGLIQSGLNLNITTNNGSATFNDSIASNGLLAINASGNVTLNENVQTFSGVTINSDQAVIINESLITGGGLSISAVDEVLLADSGSIQVSASTSITGSTITFDENSFAQFVGQASLESTGGSITVNDVNAFSGLGLTSASMVNIIGEVAVGSLSTAPIKVSSIPSDLNITAVDDVLINAGDVIEIGGHVNITAASFTMANNSYMEADDYINVNVNNGIRISQLVSNANQTDAFSLTSQNGSITAEAGAYDVTSDTVNFKHLIATGADGGALLSTATGIGSPLVVDTPWLSAETLTGDINLVTTSDAYATLLKTSKGNSIRVRALGDLNIDELLGTPWLYVDGHFVATDMTIDGGEIQSKKSIDVENIVMTESGPLSLEAPTIDVNIMGEALDELNVSMSGVANSQADWISSNIYGAQKLNVLQLNTYEGQLNTEHSESDVSISHINIADGTVSGAYAVTSDQLSFNIDNQSPAAVDVDVQALTVYDGETVGAFELELKGVEVYTNAVVSRSRKPAEIYFFRDAINQGEAIDRYDGDRNLQDITQPGDVIPKAPVAPWKQSPIVPKIFGKGVDPESIIPDVSEGDASEDEDEYSVEIAANTDETTSNEG